MLKRSLFITTNLRLSLKNNQIVISTKGMPDIVKTEPIEDIGSIILENPQISISIPLLNALVQNHVSVVLCDNHQMPSAILMDLNGNYSQGESIRAQVDAPTTLKKSLWKQIIEHKIRNQSLLLNELGKNGAKLKPYYSNVKSGDIDNKEGIAAKIYWNLLFEENFVRSRFGECPNNLLNYGYILLRAAVARSLTSSGLLPILGLFHKNKYNSFPLADDIMEPYRPYVDRIVYELYQKGVTELNKETKASLLQVLYLDTKFKTITRPLQIALSITTASLVRCYEKKDNKILYPELY